MRGRKEGHKDGRKGEMEGSAGGWEHRKIDGREARRKLPITHCGHHNSFIYKWAK